MTSKERAGLRAKANTLEAVFQVGKGGISDALIAQTQDALRARELIKLKVLLETSPETPKELAKDIALATGAEVIQVVGGSIVLFKENPELHQAKDPAKKVVKKPHHNSIPKPRIPRDKKPSAPRAHSPAGKPAEAASSKTGRAPIKQTDKKVTAHKPLHQGRPRPAVRAGKPPASKSSDKKRG